MWFVLPLVLALTQQTFYVDDGGAGDFLDLPEAVAATAPGDLLLVAPGNYNAPTITHDLTILGSAKWERPWVKWGTLVVDGVQNLTISGLFVSDLDVKNVAGRVRIDDCRLGEGEYHSPSLGTVTITDSAVVVISRSEVFGPYPQMYSGGPALMMTDSDVVLVDSNVAGADGYDDPIGPDSGWSAVWTSGNSQLLFAGCDVRGGYGGCGIMGCESGGYAVSQQGGTIELVVQGSSFHTFGTPSDGVFISNGTVSWSGVSFPDSGWQWPETVPAEPYLHLSGVDLPGATRRIEAYGAVGEACFVYFSAAPWSGGLSGVSGAPLLISPADLFYVQALTLNGQNVAATVLLPLPTNPTLVGFVTDVQGLVLTAAGPFLTNPHQIALRP